MTEGPIFIGIDFGSQPSITARHLFVPPCHYRKGEDWVRERYQVGRDVVIMESRPLPTR